MSRIRRERIPEALMAHLVKVRAGLALDPTAGDFYGATWLVCAVAGQ
jgi:hypothetical protein